MRYVLLLALIGCGGPEFTTFEPDTAADAGTVGPFADGSVPLYDLPGREAGAPREDSFVEAEAAAAAAPEAAPTCTPWSTSSACPSVACVEAGTGCTNLAWGIYIDAPGFNGCEREQAPIVCQCVETFDCACLQAHDPCPDGMHFQSCSAVGAPTVVCAQ
jgi:hypothetical protein